jgi:uncharacterized iron-regulated membrane protein
MFDISQAQMKRLTAVHGWSAVVLGLLLYAVIATGAVAVFSSEIGRWSAGGVRETTPLEGTVDAKVRRLAREVDPAFLHDVGIWAGEGRDLHVFFHDHAVNSETGVEEDFGTIFRVDGATGEVLERHDGFIWNEPAAWETSALRQFLVDLHVQLYLPRPWGLILTGILGLMMMAAVVSGFLMHRHLIRDLFVAERPGGRLVSARDRHVLSASWSLPFAFIFAFTGSFFSFAGSVSFPLVAAVAFGGDQEAMIETLFEPPVPEDPTPAPLASLDYILADSRERAGSPATFVGIANYGRADARVTVWHDPSGGGLLYVTNVFDGPSREFLGRQDPIGTAPSAGGVLYGLMYPLHFGHFAGLLSKAVWGALGVAMCVVTLSGLRLWVKRRSDGPLWRGFGRMVVVTGYGLPLAMLVSGYGYFLSQPAADPFWWTPASFLVGCAAAIAIGVRVADDARLARLYERLLGVVCLGLPILRLATGGMDWAEAVLGGQGDVLTVDLLLLVAGGSLLWHARGRTPRRRARRVALEPAE